MVWEISRKLVNLSKQQACKIWSFSAYISQNCMTLWKLLISHVVFWLKSVVQFVYNKFILWSCKLPFSLMAWCLWLKPMLLFWFQPQEPAGLVEPDFSFGRLPFEAWFIKLWAVHQTPLFLRYTKPWKYILSLEILLSHLKMLEERWDELTFRAEDIPFSQFLKRIS